MSGLRSTEKVRAGRGRQASRRAEGDSLRSGAGEGHDQSAPSQAEAHQREASDLHQHRFRDALQTSGGCWALREPTRKERAGEQAGRGRARARGCALPPARSRRRLPGLGRARGGGGRGGSSRSLSPSSFLPRVTGRTVWERPRSARIFVRRVGRAGQALLLKGKPKVRLLRASLIRGCSQKGLG